MASFPPPIWAFLTHRVFKCDEGKPTCGSCLRRGIDCTYLADTQRRRAQQPPPVLQPQAVLQPQDAVPPEEALSPQDALGGDQDDLDPLDDAAPEGYTAKHLLELRLLHQYDDSTVASLGIALGWHPSVNDTMMKEVPLLAVDFPFLMDAIMFVAMIHLACVEPDLKDTFPISLYRDQAIAAFHKVLSNMTDMSLRPAAMASILLGATSFASDRLTGSPELWVTNFMAIAKGPRLLATVSGPPMVTPGLYGSPQSSPHGSAYEAPQIHPVNFIGLVDEDPVCPYLVPQDLDTLLQISDTDIDWQYREDINHAVTGIAMLFGALASPALEYWVPFKVRVWPFQFVTPNFVQLAQQGRSRALLIMAYYLAFFNFLPRSWLYEGVAKGDMKKIYRLIETTWEPYLKMPGRAVYIDDVLILRNFLLSLVSLGLAGDLSTP